jgi:hypothetical protein
MATDVSKYINECNVCQKTKAHYSQSAGKMQALLLLRRLFESISLNFITDLPLSKDSETGLVANYLLVIVNQYTKEPEYILCLKIIDVLSLAKLFIKY